MIVMAAGSGTRMGVDMPKQFLELSGKAILQRTIERFTGAVAGLRIITVLPPSYIEYWRNYCLRKNFICPQILVGGGITRFHSVRNALEKVPEDAIVGIHDGVRPFVTPSLIRRAFDLAEGVDGVVPVLPCVDTMKVLDRISDVEGNAVLTDGSGETADRSRLFGAQTPQVFRSGQIKAAYEQPFSESFTDDASVASAKKMNLSYIIGERFNIKLTSKDDLVLAEALLALGR